MMHNDGTNTSRLEVAALVERLARQADALDATRRETAEHHQRTVQSVPAALRHALERTLNQVASDATQAVRAGLSQPLADVGAKAAEHQRLMRSSTDAMIHTQRALMASLRKVHWVTGTVFAILLATIAVGGYLIWHYTQVIAQHQVDADLLRAYHQADVRLCGKHLCARVDRTDKRYGDYLPIKRQ